MEESLTRTMETEKRMETLHSVIDSEFELTKADMKTATPLTLAFVGDNVYDLVVRTMLFEEGNRKLNDIHKKKSSLVKAETQAVIAEYLSENNLFTEEEAEYYRKGKNAKTLSHAKNAGIKEYHKATGLECVMGFLYLTDREERAVELCKLGISAYLNGFS